MKEWQFNVLFFVGVGGAILLLVGPELGFTISDNPTALTGIGAILTYVLAHRMGNGGKKPPEPPPEKEQDNTPDRGIDNGLQ